MKKGISFILAFAMMLFFSGVARTGEHGGEPMHEHAGKEVKEGTLTVTGEVIDTFCYAAMGAKGESHRQCGIECAKKGIPLGLLEDKTGKVYVLLPAKDKSPLPDAVIDKMGRKATVTGKSYTSGGTPFLTVESVK
jgi:hypothetical protein